MDGDTPGREIQRCRIAGFFRRVSYALSHSYVGEAAAGLLVGVLVALVLVATPW